MSHQVALEVVVVGLAGLIQALIDTGLAYKEQQALRTADGKKHAVDLVVTDEAGTQVGVKVDPKTGVARFIGHDDSEKKATKLSQRIAQRYAYSRAIEELRRKGYQIGKEEKQKDGTIKLVAQKWK